MERKEKVEKVFFMKEPTGIIETEDQGWLTQMANEGDIHAALILIDGMNHNYHCWDEDYINEDTNETVTVKRCEVVEGTIFPFDKALQTRLLKMIFDAKEKMSDEELAIVSNLLNGLYIDFMPIVNERIRRGDDTVAYVIDDPKLLQELCDKGNKLAAEWLGYKYNEGDEYNGIFINPQKAKEYFEMAGIDYEFEMPDEEPRHGELYLLGSAQDLASIKELVERLTQRYGIPDNELGLFVPMEVLMDELVGSKYYEGNLLFMNTDDPERIVLRVEANDLKPLRYALLQKFPSLKLRLKKWEC